AMTLLRRGGFLFLHDYDRRHEKILATLLVGRGNLVPGLDRLACFQVGDKSRAALLGNYVSTQVRGALHDQEPSQ
ncbi:MAG: hypothetical protein WCI74_19780, partial [Actinomycetes bacterium]